MTRASRWLVACSVFVAGCGAAPAAPSMPTPVEGEHDARRVRYVFAIATELDTIDVTTCFEGAAPRRLVPGVSAGAAMLDGARLVSERAAVADRPLVRDARGIDLAGIGPDACVRYGLDLGAAPGAFGGLHWGDGSVVSNPATWLWRPSPGWRRWQASARFEPAEGVDVAVPWRVTARDHALDESAFAFYGHAVFGRFERETVTVGDSVLEVAVLDGFDAETRRAIPEWIASGARAVSLVAGRLPFERAQVVVVPRRAGGDPVRFGHLTRGGGASVMLLVSRDATPDALVADWTLPHELSHLWHPFVERRSAWLSEGLATYYQEVARARGGAIPASRAWGRLYEGAALGHGASTTLAEASERVFQTYDFPRVYWGGAAIALLADVELRRQSGGTRSLDDVMAALADCCARDSRAWKADALIERIDAIAGTPVFSALVARHVVGPEHADLTDTFTRLGLRRRGAGFEAVAGAPVGWIRDAIMTGGPSEPTAAAARR